MPYDSSILLRGKTCYVEHREITSTEKRRRTQTLVELGATIHPDPASADIIISSTIDFPEYDDLSQRDDITIATWDWVKRSVLIGRLANPAHFSPDPTLFFSGVTICCADEMPSGDKDAIAASITVFGGSYQRDLTKEVTRALCTKPEGAFYRVAMDHRNLLKVVLPAWVDACLTARKLVPTQPYEWPTPPILADPASRFHLDLPEIEPVAPHERDFPRLKEELDPDNDDFSPTDEGGEADGREGAFSKLKIVLSPDLELSEGGRRSLVETLTRAGGRVVKQEREMEETGSSQVLIAKFRDGDLYLEAVRRKLTIGTIPWVYYTCSKACFVSPKNYLLHYPVPVDHIPEFEPLIISVSSYSGETREYLKKLIQTMGGTWSAGFSSVNTHVVAATNSGAKVERAYKDFKSVVNHNWLESCFIHWRLLPTSFENSASFPPGLNYMKVAGRGLTDADLRPWTDLAILPEEPVKLEPDGEREGGLGPFVGGNAEEDDGDVEMNGMEEDEGSRDAVEEEEGAEEGDGDVAMKEVVRPATQRSRVPSPSSSALNGRNPLPQPTVSTSASVSAKPRSTANKRISVVADESSSSASSSKRRRKASPPPEHKSSSTPSADSNQNPQPSPHPSPPPPPPSTASKSKRTSNASSKPRTSTASASTSHRSPSPPPIASTSASTSTSRRTSSKPKPPAPPPSSSAAHSPPPSSARPSRAAAEAAADRLHKTMPNEIQAKKDFKKGSGTGGPRRHHEDEDEEAMRLMVHQEKERNSTSASGKKTAKKEVKAEESEEKDEDVVVAEKKGKGKGKAAATERKPSKSGVGMRILTTQIVLKDEEIRFLEKQGAELISDPIKCTHLVAKAISRTEKYLCALPHFPFVLGYNWIQESMKAKEILDPSTYQLKEPKSEKLWGVTVVEALARARKIRESGKKGVLDGLTFYASPDVDVQKIKLIIETSGGKIYQEVPKPALILESPEARFVLSCETDYKRADIQKLEKAGVQLYLRDLALDGIIRQKLKFDANKFPA